MVEKRGARDRRGPLRKGKMQCAPAPSALYNTKFLFVKFDRRFFGKYFYSFSHKKLTIKKSARMPIYYTEWINQQVGTPASL